jgi:hypothetical protein
MPNSKTLTQKCISGLSVKLKTTKLLKENTGKTLT